MDFDIGNGMMTEKNILLMLLIYVICYAMLQKISIV